MASASNIYVEPTGAGLYNAMFGQQAGKWPDQNNITPIFGTDPTQSVANAWNADRLGYGTLNAPSQLGTALQDSTDRYTGSPTQGSWDQRWQQWFGTDVTGPDGNTLLSPYHQTGLRVGQDYGVGRDAQGNLAGPAGGDIYQGFAWDQNKLAQNPYLDPANAQSGYAGLMTGSPFASPNQSDYQNAINVADGRQGMAAIGNNGAQAIHGLGRDANFGQFGDQNVSDITGLNNQNDFDKYGLRGIQQTNDLASQNLRKLTRNIDTEAQNTLSMKLPEIQNTMEAAGLGRSGAAQQQMLQAQNDILGQANRDKQSTLANFQTQTLGRQADAINLATQQGYGGAGQEYGQLAGAMNNKAQFGYGGAGQVFGANRDAVNLATQLGGQAQNQFSDLQGNAAMQGLGDTFAMNEANRAGARSLWQQGIDQQNQRYGVDTGNYLNALQAGGQFQNQSLEQERLGQSAALNDYMNLVNGREQWRGNSMNEMLGLADQEQSYRQQRLNQQLQSAYMPLDLMTRVATGTTAPSGPTPARTSPWGQIGQQALGGVAGGVGQSAGDWAGALFGQGGSYAP